MPAAVFGIVAGEDGRWGMTVDRGTMAQWGRPYADIPVGWYCVGIGRELEPGAVRACRYFGRELVLYRTAAGVVRLADAFCPHLGAHLGYGGAVEGEELRCPFHGFRFGLDGGCVGTPGGGKAPAARLRMWPVREIGDLVLAWYHPFGAEPEWEIDALETRGWSSLVHTGWRLRGHPQETSENSVDLGHFEVVHSFEGARLTRPVAVDGARLTIGYAVDYRVPGLGIRVPTAFDVLVHGLGYSLVDARLPSLGLHVRELVLATPVDAETIHLRIGSMVRRFDLPIPGLARVLAEILVRLQFLGYRREVEQDFRIWRHKTWIERPRLARGDGPIATYRRYCRQFYPRPGTEHAGRALESVADGP